MTTVLDALAFARRLDMLAAADAAREFPLHEDLYEQIGDLAGGLGYRKTGEYETLADILPQHCERAAQRVKDDNPDEYTYGMGAGDPDHGPSGWLEDAMDRAYAEAAAEWLAEARKIAGPMLAVDVKVAA